MFDTDFGKHIEDLYDQTDEVVRKMKGIDIATTLIKNNGIINDEHFEIKDVFTSEDLSPFIPAAITKIVREAKEPELLIVPNLFKKVNVKKGRAINVISVDTSAVEAGEISDFQKDWPIVNINRAATGEQIFFDVSTHGLIIQFSDEVIDDSEWDILNLWLEAAGKALARHKEQYAIRLLNEAGKNEPIFDNANPSASEKGVTTGLNVAGSYNGSLTLVDLFQMFAYMILRGFTPDTLIMHPLAWAMFVTDPEMKEVVTVGLNKLPEGSPAPGWPTGFGGFGLRTKATGNEEGASPWVWTLNPWGASFQVKPKGMPVPFKILVSPYMWLGTVGSANEASIVGKPVTHLYMADSSACGALLQKQDVTTTDWKDPLSEIRFLKIWEKWGMAVFQQGKGLVAARNIVIDKNYNFTNVNQVSVSTPPTNPIVTG